MFGLFTNERILRTPYDDSQFRMMMRGSLVMGGKSASMVHHSILLITRWLLSAWFLHAGNRL